MMQTSRRKFFQGASAILGIVAFGICGSQEMNATPPNTLDLKLSAQFNTLDTIYANQGASGIELFLSNLSESRVVVAHLWMSERKHYGFLDFAASSIGDPRKKVAYSAYGLVMQLGGRTAKSILPILVAERSKLKDREFRRVVDNLIAEVEGA